VLEPALGSTGGGCQHQRTKNKRLTMNHKFVVGFIFSFFFGKEKKHHFLDDIV
jgi:hypothetical protein